MRIKEIVVFGSLIGFLMFTLIAYPRIAFSQGHDHDHGEHAREQGETDSHSDSSKKEKPKDDHSGEHDDHGDEDEGEEHHDHGEDAHEHGKTDSHSDSSKKKKLEENHSDDEHHGHDHEDSDKDGHSGKHDDHGDEHEGGDHDDHGETSPVEWTDKLIQESGIMVKSAGSGEIAVGLELPGKIVSYEPNVAHIIPRFPGIIRQAKKHLGEKVSKGDVLAVIESNQSLNPYEVRSPITGVIVKRHSTVGEYASESTDIFVVADLSTVWGEFYVFSDDFAKVKSGLPVLVEVKPIKEPISSTVSFVSRVVDEHTQSKFVRAVLPNEGEQLYPGAFANALVVLETVKAKTVVDGSALQRLEGGEVVFVWEGDTFEARPVLTGKRDKKHVQILRGLNDGERYATGNTFLIKAEIGKAEAEHAH